MPFLWQRKRLILRQEKRRSLQERKEEQGLQQSSKQTFKHEQVMKTKKSNQRMHLLQKHSLGEREGRSLSKTKKQKCTSWKPSISEPLWKKTNNNSKSTINNSKPSA
jgi:hypothetical protein